VTFADLLAGETLFLDANPLVYHFAPDPLFGAPCTQLLARIAKQEIRGVTSTHVLSEVAHHLMTLEAASTFVLDLQGRESPEATTDPDRATRQLPAVD
jgi:predicted nucleic acid-binding protein